MIQRLLVRWILMVMLWNLIPSLSRAQGGSSGAAIDRYAAGSSRSARSARSSAAPTRMDRNPTPRFMQELTTGLYWYQPTSSSMGSGLLLQGFNYSPRYAFWAPNDLMSLSAGTNLGLALQWSNFGSLFMVNVPMLVEFNLGRGSMADRDDAVGVFGGLGLEYNFINNFWADGGNLNQWGLLYSAGARVLLGGRPYVVRFSQSIGTPSQNILVTHVGLGTSLY